MSLLYKILTTSAIVIAIAVAILLRKWFRNLMQRQALTQMRNKADKMIGGNATVHKEEYIELVNKFFGLYETSIYIQKEDQIRIQKLNQIHKEQRETSSQC